MKFVEEKILEEGRVLGTDILKVDSFVNHQIDSRFADEIGEEFAKSFDDFNKVITIESSGIAFALTTAMHKNFVPVVFAKKSNSKTIDTSMCYMTDVKSFTKGGINQVMINKKYISKEDKVLIVDDFLAEGNAALGLIDLVKQAGATVVGVCAVINKTFQGGEEKINQLGYKVISGAKIKAFKDGKVIF